jgi:hypothetical protein
VRTPDRATIVRHRAAIRQPAIGREQLDAERSTAGISPTSLDPREHPECRLNDLSHLDALASLTSNGA